MECMVRGVKRWDEENTWTYSGKRAALWKSFEKASRSIGIIEHRLVERMNLSEREFVAGERPKALQVSSANSLLEQQLSRGSSRTLK
jgi:hypothetical protein